MAPRTFVSGYSHRSSSVRAVVPWLSTWHHSIVPSGVQAQSRKRPTREPCHASLTSNQCLPLVGREGLMVALALVLALALALVLALALSVQPQGLHRALRPQPSPRRPRASQMSKWCRHRLLRSARCRAVTTVVSSMLATVPRRWCCVAHAHHHVRRCRDDCTHASQESAQGPGCAAPVGTEAGLASGVHIPALTLVSGVTGGRGRSLEAILGVGDPPRMRGVEVFVLHHRPCNWLWLRVVATA